MLEKKDIINREFDKKLFGYDPTEVEYFKKMVSKEFDKLKDKINDLEEVEKKYEEISGKKSEQIIKESKEKAEEIEQNAREKAEKMVNDAQERKAKIENEINQIKIRKNSLIDSIQNIFDTQKKLLNEFYKEEDIE